MNSDETKSGINNIFSKLARYFGFVMIFIYLGFSFFLIFTDSFSTILSSFQKYGLGILFVLYSIFRAYRVFKNLKEDETV